MITIDGKPNYEGTEYFVLTVGDEPVCLNFTFQADDIMISTPETDMLVSWDTDGFSEDQCFLMKTFDNLKEFSNLKCTKFYLKSNVPGKQSKVYLVAQRN